MPSKSSNSRLQPIKHIVLDMDGTVSLDGQLFDCTLPFMQTLQDLEIGFTFMTNNSAQSVTRYESKLEKAGLPMARGHVDTSGQATIEYLQTRHPDFRRLFVLGTPDLKGEFSSAQYEIIDPETDNEPQAVIVGFNTALQFHPLCKAAYWIKKNKPFIATHQDLVCPTSQNTLLMDCGSICASLTQATGRKPDVVLGKPNPWMLERLMKRTGLSTHQIAVIGDRLYTDIQMARETGALGVLVLTGETTAEQLPGARFHPDLTVQDLSEFGQMLTEAKTT
ncbi:MAG: HAD-IIA family hydrolase [Verrucomicrobiae bacterium]|nr:HAD-IIA family hydrolase [Verrucomicrobiae bacterium]